MSLINKVGHIFWPFKNNTKVDSHEKTSFAKTQDKATLVQEKTLSWKFGVRPGGDAAPTHFVTKKQFQSLNSSRSSTDSNSFTYSSIETLVQEARSQETDNTQKKTASWFSKTVSWFPKKVQRQVDKRYVEGIQVKLTSNGAKIGQKAPAFYNEINAKVKELQDLLNDPNSDIETIVAKKEELKQLDVRLNDLLKKIRITDVANKKLGGLAKDFIAQGKAKVVFHATQPDMVIIMPVKSIFGSIFNPKRREIKKEVQTTIDIKNTLCEVNLTRFFIDYHLFTGEKEAKEMAKELTDRYGNIQEVVKAFTGPDLKAIKKDFDEDFSRNIKKIYKLFNHEDMMEDVDKLRNVGSHLALHMEEMQIEGTSELVVTAPEAFDDLENFLRKTPPSFSQSLELVRQLFQGMQDLEDAGYVHRDLKPENVFLYRNKDGSIHLRIGDFGKTKKIGKEQHVMRSGNSRFAPPEGRDSFEGERFGAMAIAIRIMESQFLNKDREMLIPLKKPVSDPLAPETPVQEPVSGPQTPAAPVLEREDEDSTIADGIELEEFTRSDSQTTTEFEELTQPKFEQPSNLTEAQKKANYRFGFEQYLVDHPHTKQLRKESFKDKLIFCSRSLYLANQGRPAKEQLAQAETATHAYVDALFDEIKNNKKYQTVAETDEFKDIEQIFKAVTSSNYDKRPSMDRATMSMNNLIQAYQDSLA